MAKRNVTYQDIARYTGFSKTTISRFFNRPESVTPDHRKQIRDALDVLDYKSNKVARILANGQTEFIGLIVPNLYLGFYAELLNLFLNTYEKYGYKFIVFSGSSHEETERRYISELLSYKVEGLIVLSHTIPSVELASYGIPIVAVEREDRCISSVNTDNYAGAVQATELLYQCRCDICLHINSQDYDPQVPASARITGFTDVCERHGMDCRILPYTLGNSYDDLQTKVETIVEDIIASYPGKRKGIFCSNDTTAGIVLNHILRKYGHLPDEFKIIGFDGPPAARQAVVPISTVAQQTDKLVESAMELLVRQISEYTTGASAQRTASEGNGENAEKAVKEGNTVNGGDAFSPKPEHRIIPPILMPRGTSRP